MGSSKTDINLRRLLNAAPRQHNLTKLMHYVVTLRELLEQLVAETTPEGLPRISKTTVNDYADKIEALAAKLPAPSSDIDQSPVLRRRLVSHSIHEEINHELDATSQEHIEKHRKLQEYLTDEMVGLACQLKESSLMISQSLQEAEKLVESTEKAVVHSLASTGHANARAMEMHSKGFKTACFTWILVFAMTCLFVMVVLLIRVT